MKYRRNDTEPEYWKQFFRSGVQDPYIQKDYEYFLSTTLPEALKNQDFWWKDLSEFYISVYNENNKSTKKTHYFELGFLKDLIATTGLDVNCKDKGGNTFIHYLFSFGFQAKCDYSLRHEQIESFIDLLKNPLDKNNNGENVFWYLNNILYTHLEAEEKLLPLIKKYKIAVLDKNKYGLDLFEKAISDNLEDSMALYMRLGAKIENRKSFLEGFLFSFWPQQKIKGDLFKKALEIYDPFDNLMYKKTQFKADSLIESWISFLNDNRSYNPQHLENLIYVCSRIQKNAVLLKPKNEKKIKRCFTELKKKIQTYHLSTKKLTPVELVHFIDETQVCIDKYYLNKKISLTESAPKTTTQKFKI